MSSRYNIHQCFFVLLYADTTSSPSNGPFYRHRSSASTRKTHSDPMSDWSFRSAMAHLREALYHLVRLLPVMPKFMSLTVSRLVSDYTRYATGTWHSARRLKAWTVEREKDCSGGWPKCCQLQLRSRSLVTSRKAPSSTMLSKDCPGQDQSTSFIVCTSHWLPCRLPAATRSLVFIASIMPQGEEGWRLVRSPSLHASLRLLDRQQHERGW